jgi:hypothetical protein
METVGGRRHPGSCQSAQRTAESPFEVWIDATKFQKRIGPIRQWSTVRRRRLRLRRRYLPCRSMPSPRTDVPRHTVLSMVKKSVKKAADWAPINALLPGPVEKVIGLSPTRACRSRRRRRQRRCCWHRRGAPPGVRRRAVVGRESERCVQGATALRCADSPLHVERTATSSRFGPANAVWLTPRTPKQTASRTNFMFLTPEHQGVENVDRITLNIALSLGAEVTAPGRAREGPVKGSVKLTRTVEIPSRNCRGLWCRAG